MKWDTEMSTDIKTTGMSKLDELIKNSRIPALTARNGKRSSGRRDSDEYYVIRLCDEALGQVAMQQHKFDFLRGDTGYPLPVDAYYPSLNLVVEYYEIQHTQSVKLFNHKMTVSGVDRDEQRRIYDERRRTELPKHGIKVVIINYTDFGSSKKLIRNHDRDLGIIKSILTKNNINCK